jgi:class 3 adenylate cyclase/tetratricopeptide (TPR) repeat protein
MTCPACGHENPADQKFCGECGTPLARTCQSCGTTNAPMMKFCGECGDALVAQAPSEEPRRTPTPTAERRLVTVLFADLVGFTAASEDRDAEETRELLSRYFEQAKTIVERYGGTVEKFIGDAVMAVWGTPVAQEDDAERAVRAALDLVASMPDLHPALQARAGVLTGEAAVTLGAEGQGMVAGDLVNTASRIQSEAEPGAVLVGESTKRASEAAVAYASAGEHELKGKAGPVPLWRALRVTAGRGGALKSVGLEPPFVGRDRELRLVKELFHASADESRAQLVSVIGIAGIGKSRLGWEYFKYMDGVQERVFWHRGRCLAYGEGVAFWALAEMVRMRAGITEGEEPASAVAKVRASVEEFLFDNEERRFVEPRLLHLLGLEDGPTRGKEELFGAWRLFFERMAEQGPVALLFEDLQWADAALVEFIGHLLEWARQKPIFVLCLARPELQSRHPDFGHGSHQTTLSLAPLSEPAMRALLDGFVPGLPEELRERILARAEGVPLYAVETVRTLLDRGLLVEEDGVYRVTGEVAELEVPETLQGLIAARLDGLAPEERRLLQDASVLGKTFTKESLAALSGPEAELDPLLAGLVRKEVLGVQADPRSPERGQYGFLQDLVRRVAYETLARRDRKSRHLAAAAQLEASFGVAEQEIVEVVAAHYVAAYEAQPDADDAADIKAKAREHLARAGERAGSLAAVGEARRSFERAAELADEPVERARLLERAGFMAVAAAEYEPAERALTEALALLEDVGERHAAARVSARVAFVEQVTSRYEQALERLENAFAAVAGDEPDADIAELASRLGSSYAFAGDLERAVEPTELALDVAQALRLPETLSRALNVKAMLARGNRRPEEELAFLRHAIAHALEHDLPRQAATGYGNLSDACFSGDRYGEALDALGEGLALVRRIGDRRGELYALSETSYALAMTGRWDEALATASQIPEEHLQVGGQLVSVLTGLVEVHLHRGRVVNARELVSLFGHLEGSIDPQDSSGHAAARAALEYAEGDHRSALEQGLAAVGTAETQGAGNQSVKQGFVWAAEAALALEELTRADELLTMVEELPPGIRPPFLEAQVQRFRARMTDDEEGFKGAAGGFREYNFPFWLAVAQLEHAEWLVAHGRTADAEPLLAEAREIFARLEAAPWLERAESVGGAAKVPA